MTVKGFGALMCLTPAALQHSTIKVAGGDMYRYINKKVRLLE